MFSNVCCLWRGGCRMNNIYCKFENKRPMYSYIAVFCPILMKRYIIKNVNMWIMNKRYFIYTKLAKLPRLPLCPGHTWRLHHWHTGVLCLHLVSIAQDLRLLLCVKEFWFRSWRPSFCLLLHVVPRLDLRRSEDDEHETRGHVYGGCHPEHGLPLLQALVGRQPMY